VRAPKDAGAGTATARLSFDAWKDGRIRPAELSIPVVAPRRDSKPEPVSRRLVRTLIHTDRQALIGTVLFAPDGKWIAGCGLNGTGGTQVWDATTGKQLHHLPTPKGYLSQNEPLPAPPDGHTLSVPIRRDQSIRMTKDGHPAIRQEVDGEIQVWDLATGRKLPSLRHTPPRGIRSVALSSDGHWLAAVERQVIDDGKHIKNFVALWDVRARTSRDLAEGRWLPSFAPDGTKLAVPTMDAESKRYALGLWDVASGKRRTLLRSVAHFYGMPVFSPDGRYVAVGLIRSPGLGPEVKLWEVATCKEVGAFAAPEKAEFFHQLSFSPDGRLLAAATLAEGKVFLYDAQARKLVREHTFGNKPMLRDPVFSPDGKWLAVPGQPIPEGIQQILRENPLDLPQPRVFLFDLSDDHSPEVVVAPHGFVGRTAFSRDGRTLGLGGHGCVWLFDLSWQP
jgi:WD40 repeat protein